MAIGSALFSDAIDEFPEGSGPLSASQFGAVGLVEGGLRAELLLGRGGVALVVGADVRRKAGIAAESCRQKRGKKV